MFHIGDEVMLLRQCNKNEMGVQWEGPAKAVSRLSNMNYEVKLGKNQNKIYHSNLMKPYFYCQAVVNLTLNVPEEQTDFLCFPQGSDAASSEFFELIAEEQRLSESQRDDFRAIVRDFEPVFSDQPEKTTLMKQTAGPQQAISNLAIAKENHASRDLPNVRLVCRRARRKYYTSPLILVEVQGKEQEPCVDYCRLISVTLDQAYPIPNIEERVERVVNSMYISTLCEGIGKFH